MRCRLKRKREVVCKVFLFPYHQGKRHKWAPQVHLKHVSHVLLGRLVVGELTHLFLISGKHCFSEPCPPPAHFHVFISQNWVTDTPGSKESRKFRDLASSLCNRGRLGRKGIETGTELPSQQCLPKQKEPRTIPKPYKWRILPHLNNYFSLFLAPNSIAIFSANYASKAFVLVFIEMLNVAFLSNWITRYSIYLLFNPFNWKYSKLQHNYREEVWELTQSTRCAVSSVSRREVPGAAGEQSKATASPRGLHWGYLSSAAQGSMVRASTEPAPG